VIIYVAFHPLAKIHNEVKMIILDSDPVLSAMGKDMKLKYDKYWGGIGEYESANLFWSYS
jgi:hypothetical protein